MGLLDALRSLLGGDSAREADGSPSSPSGELAAQGGAGGPPSGGPRAGGDSARMQSHGTHWDALVPDAGRETAIQKLVMEAASEGEVLAGESIDGTEVSGHRLRDGPLGTLAVTIGPQIATAYPVADGIEHEFAVSDVVEWESGVEAWIEGSLDDASVSAFATNYFEHAADRFEGRCTASFALLAYDLGEADDSVVDADGEAVDLTEMAGFVPWQRGAPDDVVVRTVVDAVETVSHGGHEAYRIQAPLFRTPDEEDVTVPIYAGTHVLDGYEPRPGDSVEGVGWLQATVE